ncbi:MarR family winged helix-turn-helix transcriptional regulator [Granulicella cerasi]|uniref:MarR family winged helix-turn-helix transcriptional regulator n=1 Tax=Granulicella cerasi TaxID=741063 RepID=A0ABW1Z6D3_9BACT|nr:MarR family winged helix-turn-helix transcriptional regulator [Granulicella cerasi]
MQTSRRFDAMTAELFKPDGLSLLEALVLSALFFESAVPVKPSQLAETFDTTRSNVSHCISSLEARGFVQRKVDPADARAYHLVLKPQGRKVAVRVIGAMDKLQNHFEQQVGRDSLRRSLGVIRKLATPE